MIENLFEELKSSLLSLDPVYYCENYLTLDGSPFRLHGNGYRPFADIYRYIGIKALEKDAKPVIIVKGRQVGATTMAAALELFFMTSGIFGTANRAPMRVMHAFPLLDLSYTYTKTKLNTMISTAVLDKNQKKGVRPKTYVEARIDRSATASESLQFKQFLFGNHILIESTGLTGDRIRGRQLCLKTELPTPTGFVKLEDLKEGDRLFDEKGEICKVTKLHPIQKSPESYRVTFDDGTTVDACAEHLWLTYTKKDRRKLAKGEEVEPSIKNTKEILETLQVLKENNHSIPNCLPLQYEKKNLLIDPYLLGLWLGDGNRQAQTSNWGISKSCSYGIAGLATDLRKLGLVYNPGPSKRNIEDGYYHKYIPENYLHASVKQRLSLLQGLMDSDGCCYKDGRCEFVQVREKLAYDVYNLIISLGIKVKIRKRDSYRYGVRYKDKYRITFSTDLSVFKLKRKLERIRSQHSRVRQRFIVSIEPIKSKPMRCITVDSPSCLYLVTRTCIPTHNTVDCIFFDECFPYRQYIETDCGKEKIGKLYQLYKANKKLPLVKTYNEYEDKFEYKKILNVWKRDKRKLVDIHCSHKRIKCTPNHRFLTSDGWKRADELVAGDLLKSSIGTNLHIRALNDDQFQIILGSFLGDGHLSTHKLGRYRVKIIHCLEQKEYCSFKASCLGVDVLKFIPQNGYSKKPAVRFSTKNFGISETFPKNKSTCPQWVLDKLDERGLAIWFMDDGSVNKNNACISTCSFDEDSHKRMVVKLKSMGIDCHYAFYFKSDKNKGYYSIYINKNGYQQLCKLIAPYVCDKMGYKINFNKEEISSYTWNKSFKGYGYSVVDKVLPTDKEEFVYDIEIEDNHNFITTTGRKSKSLGGPIAHNCQDIPGIAMANTIKTLAQAHYGPAGSGIQVYFGTPKQKGSDFWNIWQVSSQQYYYLGCESCGEHFPLYTPESNDWESVWIEDNIPAGYVDPKTGLMPHGFIVKCMHCDHEQDKRPAAERGKWVSSKPEPDDCKFIGYHINQLYMPNFTRERVLAEKPEFNPINTERAYQNEVLGEFFAGDASPITPEEMRVLCADETRSFRRNISLAEGKKIYMGADWGQKVDMDQLVIGDREKKQRGQSYSAVVVLSAEGPHILSVEFAKLLKRNDMEYKRAFIDETFRRYSVTMGVGDIGYANDLTEVLQQDYGDRFLASRAVPKIKHHARFNTDIFPKEIAFERNYYISELYDLMKKQQIRFPYGSYEQIGWLVQHCCSMEIQPKMSRTGNIEINYIKGSTPNDGFMALLNAYIAYKFDITNGFTIQNPNSMMDDPTKRRPIMAVTGYVPRMNPLKR
ncbi:hypothetical protein LCGC14_0390050 [marine sediment metagenome]|uniref:DOD-type homing endonuclease domain-containing protein n=1 Tax=marine sediment metagenome TaxID=412755 RepID=A0A0F9W8U5_9ZZZZ